MESIYYNCSWARRAAAESNEKEGWVGCAKYIEGNYSPPIFIVEAEECGEGWVDLRSRPFGKSSGITTNLQLLTRGVKKCIKFEKK